ncbi:hypothetical protein TNIN_21211 [Trichonephila inaurata madagascariensis]|uniref:C2H2-type domain-containing protein n=1 Tax=Trichonephila inaurata madagascariensis TaxID=2747483 RepID=A0A8X6YCA8_9ARAC|nr:hypothetical protein TNIN_21211 [Trichonephila inaurata madagascariensis]
MPKKLDKTEDSDEIRRIRPRHFQTSNAQYFRYSPTVVSDVLDLIITTSLPEDINPQREDISENKLEKDEKCVVETEKSQKELDCKKCGETFKDLEGLIAHNCPHKETKETKLDLPTIINFLVEKQLSVHKSKNSPDESIRGDSSKNRTSSVVSQRSLSSRRSLPAPMTFCPEKERTKTFSDKYPAQATSSQSFPYSLTLKDYLLSERDSAAKNLFQPRERSHSDSGYRKSVPPTKTKHTKIEVSKLVLPKYPTYVTPPRSIPSSQAPKDNFLNVKDSAIRNLLQPYKIPCSATGYRSPQSECIEKDSTRSETLVTSKKDSPESLSLTTCKQFSSSSTETSIGDSSKGLTGSVTTHKFPSRKSFPPTKTRHTKMEASKPVSQKYPTYVTPPRSIPSSQALKDDFINVKDSATQSPWYYKGEIIAYSSGSVRNATPQIFEIYDGTIETSSPEIESENFDSSESSTFSLPKPVSPFKKSNEDSSGSVVDTISDVSPKEELPQTEGERSDNYPGFATVNVIKSPKNSSPPYDSSRFFKFPGASRLSQTSSSSEDGISPRKKGIKKHHDEYISFDEDIRTSSSLKPFSKDSIYYKEWVKMNPSQSPSSSTISEEKLTPETESGESHYLSFGTPKKLSPSFRAHDKDSSGGAVNPETVEASHSPKNPNISDEKRSPETKERAKESSATCLSSSTPKKGSPKTSQKNTRRKSKKQKRR